jgi:hypothetical protein
MPISPPEHAVMCRKVGVRFLRVVSGVAEDLNCDTVAFDNIKAKGTSGGAHRHDATCHTYFYVWKCLASLNVRIFVHEVTDANIDMEFVRVRIGAFGGAECINLP